MRRYQRSRLLSFRQLADPFAIGLRNNARDLGAVRIVKAAVAAPDLEAGRQTLHVPFPGPGNVSSKSLTSATWTR